MIEVKVYHSTADHFLQRRPGPVIIPVSGRTVRISTIGFTRAIAPAHGHLLYQSLYTSAPVLRGVVNSNREYLFDADADVGNN